MGRAKRIFDLWLACYTDSEIAKQVDLSEEGVRKLTQQMEDLPEVGKAAAAHLTDFDVPLYNVWKQQEKTPGSSTYAKSLNSAFQPPFASVDRSFL